MYRLRTADKGRPLIISDKVITEYADCEVDTLHKKNLLSLGEDRYLTTLMTKHFPAMSYKFISDAYASTAAPETWSVLLSQRRRWINSTIHNLAELVFLKDLCGFCCFSMRFVVFIDLFGTIILPATCVYLGYLIYRVSTGTGQFPLISIVMIAAVYGLQAIIFIIKRQWQHIGWMIIYIIAFPIYSFVLPIYSFWNQDNFSWGNTRIVIGEKGTKQIMSLDDEGFDPRSIPLQRWDDYALQNNLPGRRGNADESQEKSYAIGQEGAGGMEMDDIQSVYSSIRPASTVLTSFPYQQQGVNTAPPRASTALGGTLSPNRMSTATGLTQFRDQPTSLGGRQMSTGILSSPLYRDHPPNSPYQSGLGMQYNASRPSLLGMPTASSYGPYGNYNYQHGAPSVGPYGAQRRSSSHIDFRSSLAVGPDDFTIVEAIQSCLREVDLETVTKKQGMSLPSFPFSFFFPSV
jgi:chitin synthase